MPSEPPVLNNSILAMLLVLAVTANCSVASNATFVPPNNAGKVAESEWFWMRTVWEGGGDVKVVGGLKIREVVREVLRGDRSHCNARGGAHAGLNLGGGKTLAPGTEIKVHRRRDGVGHEILGVQAIGALQAGG